MRLFHILRHALRRARTLITGKRWCVMTYLPEHGGRYVVTAQYRTRLAAQMERMRLDLDAAAECRSPHLVGRLP